MPGLEGQTGRTTCNTINSHFVMLCRQLNVLTEATVAIDGSKFKVENRLSRSKEGGRKIIYQHLRCDFIYEGDDPEKNGIYMIHPEFLDENRMPVPEEIPVLLNGLASMWVLIPEMRKEIHSSRLKVGTSGYFMEGARKIGKVVVEEIVGLHENSA